MVPGNLCNQTPASETADISLELQNNIPTISDEQHYLDLAYQIQRANRNNISPAPSSISAASITAIETAPESSAVEEDPVEVREIGQIDRLNNRLLNAFLERINSSFPPLGQTGEIWRRDSDRFEGELGPR